MRYASLATLIAVAFGACSGSAAQVCTPNQAVICVCPDQRLGERVCNEQGTGFTACMACGEVSSLDGGVVAADRFTPGQDTAIHGDVPSTFDLGGNPGPDAGGSGNYVGCAVGSCVDEELIG